MGSRRYRRFQGSAMGVVLAVAALALLASFTAAGVATMNLRVSSRVGNVAVADALAESAVAEALARLQGDLAFDKAVTLDGPALGLPEGSRGFLTFDPDAGEPFSTNNFLGEDSQGWKRTLPDQTAHLIGVGESGGVRRHVEVLVHLPEFPVSMACDGPIRVTDSLIGGFEPKDDRPWVEGSGYLVRDDELSPGHLITNSTDGDSLVLDKESRVTGDVQSRGEIALNGARVGGEVRAHWAQKAPLPKFKLEDFDPKGNENTHYEELAAVGSSLTLIGNVRAPGSVKLDGDLRLDNAFLFVDGDLTVDGALRGVGAVVVSGKIVFDGSANLATNEQIAVLSGKGIALTGEDQSRSVFRGLLYTRGPFASKKITIVGGLIVDGEDTPMNPPTTDITETNLYFDRESTSISPEFNREVFAVIPRFLNTASSFEIDPTKFPFGKGSGLLEERTVHNVLDPTDPKWRPSSWQQDDPAIISIRWLDGKPRFRYQYWGLLPKGRRPPEGYDPKEYHQWNGRWANMGRNPQEYESAEQLAEAVADYNSNSESAYYLRKEAGGSAPSKADHKDMLKAALDYLVKGHSLHMKTNFALGPNEFIGEDQEIRVMMHRSF